MGKARILSAQGEGLYSIEILEDRTRAESRKVRAQQRISDIDTALTDLEQDLDAAQLAVDDGATAQDQAIADYQAEPTDEHRQAMQDQAAKVIKLAEARDSVRTQIASLNLERLTLQNTIDRVDELPALRQQNAWCADYTEDLSGEVATAEVPGEVGQVVIRPGYDDGAAWSASEDGAIQPALAGTPASVFYNLAMMPGWQKWRPTFRIATITAITNDLCDITLDSASSSQQGLNVNAQGSYSGVPIYYMDCNVDAFEAGDRVLVAFSGNTDLPMVVGFESEPKECPKGFYTKDDSSFFGPDPGGLATTIAGVAIAFSPRRTVTVNSIMRQATPETSNGDTAIVLCEISGQTISQVLVYRWLDETTGGSTPGDTHVFDLSDSPATIEAEKTYAILTFETGMGQSYQRSFKRDVFFDFYSWIDQAFPSRGNETLLLDYGAGSSNSSSPKPAKGSDLSVELVGDVLDYVSDAFPTAEDKFWMEGMGINTGL